MRRTMKYTKGLNGFVSLSALALMSSSAWANVETDNSFVNRQDVAPDAMTADRQTFNKKDTRITRLIRQDLMEDEKLSVYAQNIKIITLNGRVTMKGPVRTMGEKNAVLRYARSVAGASNVIDQTTIVPEKSE